MTAPRSDGSARRPAASKVVSDARAHADRSQRAYAAQLQNDPDNLTALAMLGKELQKAEARWRLLAGIAAGDNGADVDLD